MGEATAISASVVLSVDEMVEVTDEFLSSAWKISLRSWSPCRERRGNRNLAEISLKFLAL